ncbi:MAG: O-antigen ligase C-terminal domain-containing protein [Burkholderiales bacterium]|nr:O-antigen ligase C-terminal domain-containing protein [Burkholderiales bacterium]
MNSPSSLGDRPEIRLSAYVLALLCPPLLAWNRTPSATQLNELLCVLCWGLCLLAANALPTTGLRRAPSTWLVLPLGIMGLAVVGSWTLGSLPTSLALAPLLSLVAACFVAALGVRSSQGGERDGLEAFAPFAFGVVAVGVSSALIAVLQVYFPSLCDGTFIAQSGIPGRAVGNLRQPNHLASLLVWSVIALVPLVEWGRIPRWLGAILLVLIMWAVFLSGSRTGLLGGAVVLVLWVLADWLFSFLLPASSPLPRMSVSTRVALVASCALALVAPWLTSHLGHSVIGTATRANDGDSSHFAIWRNTVEMIRQQPWLGVGWGEFNFAWTLTPFPHRPVAFFDHTHDLPLQLLVELGVPLGVLVLGLLLWALGLGLARAWTTPGAAGHGARAASIMVLMIAIHSLDEYPLWYLYFLLPAAWAWGFTLGSGPSSAEPALRGVGRGRPLESGVVIRMGSEGTGLRVFGVAMIVVALLCWWDYMERVSTIFLDEPGLPPLVERIQTGETSPLFAHHADYAEATTTEPPSRALGALSRSTHSLLDSRLMIAWANALAESGQNERARYLVARLKEFHKEEADEFFAPCADDTLKVKPFQCQPEPTGLSWRDFR